MLPPPSTHEYPHKCACNAIATYPRPPSPPPLESYGHGQRRSASLHREIPPRQRALLPPRQRALLIEEAMNTILNGNSKDGRDSEGILFSTNQAQQDNIPPPSANTPPALPSRALQRTMEPDLNANADAGNMHEHIEIAHHRLDKVE